MSPMRTVVFINSHSRRAASNIESVKSYFSESKIFDVIDFIIVEDLKQFDSYIDRLQRIKEVECVIVGSGDGTIVAVLNALKGRKDLLYGFLPLGTTNAFARSLGLSLGVKKSLQILERGRIRRVCLGSVNDRLFANAAGIGLDAQTALHMDARLKRYLSTLAYQLSALRVLRHHKAMECELHLGDKILTFLTHQIVIVNGNHYGPIPISKTISVYDPQFTIIYGTSLNYWSFVNDVYSFFIQRQHKRRNLTILSVDRVFIKTKPKQLVQADGEIIGKTPAEIKIIKDAIRVLVPEN